MDGKADLTFKIHKDTRCLVLNAKELSFDSGAARFTILNGDGHTHTIDGIDHKSDNQQIIVRFPIPLEADSEIKLELPYSSTLNEKMKGMYLSRYENVFTGKTDTMVSTQFEATYARWAFPCMDEPSFKAPFAIEIDGVPDGFTALSNMPQVSQDSSSTGPGQHIVFAKSVPMSTYLVAIVVAEMESVGTTTVMPTGEEIEVRVWAPTGRNQTANLGYALADSAKVITFYASYFGVPYPLPKLDNVAIPSFAAGGELRRCDKDTELAGVVASCVLPV